ncbi:MAG: hypothetical protein ACRC7N_03640 [Clostridium sp.]
MMIQPRKDEITNKLKKIIDNKITREDVGRWALEFIRNDDNFEVQDVKAWHYLVAVSGIDEMIAPDEYLYSIEDIEYWIEESNKY